MRCSGKRGSLRRCDSSSSVSRAARTSACRGDVDLALVRVLRPLYRVVYTLGGPYHPDPALGFGPLPGLAGASTLAASKAGSDEAGFAEASLIRERNRLIDALDQAIAEAERLSPH